MERVAYLLTHGQLALRNVTCEKAFQRWGWSYLLREGYDSSAAVPWEGSHTFLKGYCVFCRAAMCGSQGLGDINLFSAETHRRNRQDSVLDTRYSI